VRDWAVLPAAHRLTDAAGFRHATARGRRSGSRTLVAHAVTGSADGGTPARVGFVVSKAVGNAVTRNRVKRRLRHLVGSRLTDVPGGSIVVVRALPAAAAASHSELGRDLERCLQRVLR
jgi:ribonuclease P protein component